MLHTVNAKVTCNSEPQKNKCAGPTNARLLSIILAKFDCLRPLHALRPEASADLEGGGLHLETFLLETLHRRLPLKNSSHSLQTLAKHVSDDPRHFIFRSPKTFCSDFCSKFLSLFSAHDSDPGCIQHFIQQTDGRTDGRIGQIRASDASDGLDRSGRLMHRTDRIDQTDQDRSDWIGQIG